MKLEQSTKRIMHLKLNTGEEVIARVTSLEDGKYSLDKPLAIIATTGPGGQLGVGVVPFSLVAQESSFICEEAQIAGIFEPLNSNLEKDYISRTSSIQLATSMPPNLG